jgi:acyl dehydratase
MSGQLPSVGVSVIPRALLTYGRKARPLKQTFNALYASHPPLREHVLEYKKFTGFPGDQSAPLSYWYLFAQRAQLALMMDPRFSYPVPGIVHVSNVMQQFAPVNLLRAIDIEVSVSQESIDERGGLYVSFDVMISQFGIAQVSCKSRYLARRTIKKTGQSEITKVSEAVFLHLADWALESDVGRQYARISGDYNPIHLWPWSANLLGFKKPIAHGMFLVSKAQAMLEQTMGTPVTQMSATFMRPAMVPGQLRLERTSDQYRILSSLTVCATGTFWVEPNLRASKNEG